MKAFPTAVGLALAIFLVQDSTSSPIMIRKDEHFAKPRTIVKVSTMGSEVPSNGNNRPSEEDREMNNPEPPASFSEITFKLFSVYDRRGPWQPRFLPQPPLESI
jgi:hypothetical protein